MSTLLSILPDFIMESESYIDVLFLLCFPLLVSYVAMDSKLIVDPRTL